MRIMRLFLLFSFNAVMLLEGYGLTNEADRQALLKFKSQVSEGKRVVLSSWNNSFHLCNWKGVTCGRKHKRVTRLDLGGLQLGGVISPSIGNLSFLVWLNLSNNSFGGTIPQEVGNLFRLKYLFMYSNVLRGGIPYSLSNCSRLFVLCLNTNNLGEGIPSELGSLKNLFNLDLGDNNLKGSLPTSLGNLSNLGLLGLSSNRFSGEIPSSICNITRLLYLYLSNNGFEGIFLPSLGKCNYLLDLVIDNNKLNGSIPQEIMLISSLIHLSMDGNSLSGSLPSDVGRLQNLVQLSLGNNNLSGKLPQALGKCFSMEELYLQGNSFDGAIPDISGLVGVKKVNFSNNDLSGSIPGYFANFSSLEYLDLSINNFEGRVPTEQIFQNASIISVFGNKNLCGGIKEMKLKPCLAMGTNHSSLSKKIAIGVSVGIALFLLLFTALVCLRWFRKRKKIHQTNNPTSSTLEVFHEKISYGDLRTMTDGFSLRNLIGSGSFGTVFKAFLPTDNKVVAVKVLNMQRRGAMKSFMAECESLKDIRHRNLVKLLTACSSIDFQGNNFRALIYEFMPNGSLDIWLHPEEVEETRRPSRTLTLFERLNIAIDVASVLDYLHVHCHEPIAHCDIKPSNVLLDNDLVAHISDFGLARLLLKFDQEPFFNQLSSVGVRGTIGYVAPEYGMGGQPSIHGDVYSFGVLLLEMFTGKRPINESFEGTFTLHSYTKSALPERVEDIADKSILESCLRIGFPVFECLAMVLEVGIRCCEESPMSRLVTSEARKELISIRERFFRSRRTARR